jgi:predicted RNA-binding Zn-ribbon protein involved in translation (DUF1610 family)
VPTPAPHRRLLNRILTVHPPWWGEVWFIVLAAFLWIAMGSSFPTLAGSWWVPVALLILALVLAIARGRRRQALETTIFEIDSGRCIRCEYDLTKLDGSLLCPECGTDNHRRREHARKHLSP